MSTAAVEQRLTYLWETPKTVYGWFATVDHKKLGKRYLVTAFIFMIIGGIEALMVRLQLAHANQALLTPEMYDQVFSMHGITMIFWYASPILSGFAVYFIPLMIGARDMAFPRLNAFTYWSFLFSGILLYVAPIMGQAPHAGWFAYVPYTLRPYSPEWGMDFYAVSLILLTISTTANAINFVVTIGNNVAIAEGRKLFLWYNCAGCHGGHAGGGMGPSLRDPVWIYGSSDAQIFDTIAQGRAHGMPAWGTKVPEQQIWKLVVYIKSLRTPQEPDPPMVPPSEQVPSPVITYPSQAAK